MPDYELHADYDRNGSLAANASEYGLRAKRPGAVVVPNLDADGRALPSEVKKGPRVVLDTHQPVKPPNDDENLPVRIHTHKDSAPPGSQFFLRILGRMKIHIEFHDARGIILKHPPGVQDDVLITPPPVGKDLNLTVEVGSLAGTPHGQSTMLDTAYKEDGEVDARFGLELRSRDPSGKEVLWDSAEFSIAPVILMDSMAPAVRLYICNTGDNWPSVSDVVDAVKLMSGVELVDIKDDVGGGDTWLQDQFQHGVMQGSDGYRQVLIDLPRLRSSNAANASGHNLADFVMSHFPSRQVGVFDDLWNRSFLFNDHKGGEVRVSYRNTFALSQAVYRVESLRETLIVRIQRFDPAFNHPGRALYSKARSSLRDLYGMLRRRIQTAVSAGKARADTGREFEKDSRERLEAIEALAPMSQGAFTLPTGKGTITVDADTADCLYLRLSQIHHSSNFGGNFEASPPIEKHVLGKLVVGNAHFDVNNQTIDFIDPDVFRVFKKQNKQPMVEINTTWLEVGHVDEVISFVPDGRNARPGFAVLLASGALAQTLLVKARERYKAGLPAGYHQHKTDEPSISETTRLTTAGFSPVTRLFRGKVWSHVHLPETPETAGKRGILEPPQIYQRLDEVMGDMGDIRYAPGASDEDRVYLADTSVREVAWCEQDNRFRSVNQFIEKLFLSKIGDTMAKQFPGARRFPVPVLFDRVSDVDPWLSYSMSMGTMAYTPDMVNLQVVNGRLLVPRPYGPRMRLDDVRAIFAEISAELKLDKSLTARLDDKFVRAKGLHAGVYWIVPYDTAHVRRPNGLYMGLTRGLLNEEDIIEQFKDSFPGASDADLRKKIIQPNKSHFKPDGTLKKDWLKFTITDDMIDLFQAWMELVAEELKAPISWIDTWDYHIYAGGIHCGTNVLRIPRRGVLPNAWDAKDVMAPPQEFDFTKPLEVSAPG